MSDPKLPGLNYETPLGITDLSLLEEVYTAEFLKSLRLVSGGADTYATIKNHGIVDESDPKSIDVASTATIRPLQVRRVSEVVMDQVVVKPGIAVTPSGHIVTIVAPTVGDITLSLAVGKVSVVFAEYEVAPDTDTVVVTRYNSSAAKRNKDVSSVKVVLLTDYQNPAIFTPDRLRNIVVLAVCSVTATSSSLTIDVSQTTYTFNRPWFSAVDIEHRNLIGTGLPTTPHSLGLNDLSAGAMTLYQQLVRHGVVLGRDKIVAGAPGHLCTQLIPAGAILTDDGSGTVTGVVSARYFKLSFFPTRLIAIIGVTSSYPVQGRLLARSNIVVLHSSESDVLSNGCTVYATGVNAAQPAVQVLQNDELNITQPIRGDELVIAGGKALDTLTGTVAKFGTSAPIPYFYNVFMKNDGQPLINPQVVKCPVLVSDLGSSLHPFDSAAFGPGKVRVGIAQGSSSGAWSMTVKIYGKDSAGTSINEVLLFVGSGPYFPPTIPSDTVSENPFLVTTQVFYSLDNIQIVASTNLTSNEILTAYVQMNHIDTPGFADLSPIARVTWNGQAVSRVNDTRNVVTHLGNLATKRTPSRVAQHSIAAGALLNALAIADSGTPAGFKSVALEDFQDPHFIDYRFSSNIFFDDGMEGWSGSGLPYTNFRTRYFSRAIEVPTTAQFLYLVIMRHRTSFDESNGNQTLAVQGSGYTAGSPTSGSALGFAPVSTWSNADLEIYAAPLTNYFKVALIITGAAYGYELFTAHP